MSNLAQGLRAPLLALAGILLLIVLPWWLAVSGGIRPVILPSLSAVYNSMIEMIANGTLARHTWTSLVRVNVGFALAIVTAIPLGILLGSMPRLNRAFEPMIESFRFVIPFSWIPLVVLWFGTSEAGKYFLIWYAGFFILVLPTIEAVKTVDPDYVKAARTLGAGRRVIFFKVLLPAILLELVTALRVAFAMCWIALLSAELVASRGGLGYLILDAREVLETDVVIVGMIVIGVIGALYNWVFRLIERRFHF